MDNPQPNIYRFSSDEVATMLRKALADNGVVSRMAAVQISVVHPFAADTTFHSEIPTLVVLISSS